MVKLIRIDTLAIDIPSNMKEETFLKLVGLNKVNLVSHYNGINMYELHEKVLRMDAEVKLTFSFKDNNLNSIAVLREYGNLESDEDTIKDSYIDFNRRLKEIYGNPNRLTLSKYNKQWDLDNYIIRHSIINRFGMQEELVFVVK